MAAQDSKGTCHERGNKRAPAGKYITFYDMVLEFMQCHFYLILFIRPKSSRLTHTNKRAIRPHCLWKGSQTTNISFGLKVFIIFLHVKYTPPPFPRQPNLCKSLTYYSTRHRFKAQNLIQVCMRLFRCYLSSTAPQV